MFSCDSHKTQNENPKMRKRTSAKSSICFLFLAVGFVMLFSPFVGRAQNNSANLAGKWSEKPIYPGPILGDLAEVIIQLIYTFDNSSKVTQVSTVTKGMGRRMAMNYQTGQMYCCDTVYPVIAQASEVGTYKITGNSILLEFSKFRRRGIITDNLIKGVKIDKLTGKEYEWIIARTPLPDSRGKESLPANVIRNVDGKLEPANGFWWVSWKDPDDLRVEVRTEGVRGDDPSFLDPRRVFDPNVVGKLIPANGYRWINDDPKDFRVEPMPGLIETRADYGKLSPLKGYKLNPAKGYRWLNRNDPKDLRVEQIP